MQGKQANQGQGHSRDSGLVRTVKGQGRCTKLVAVVFISCMISILGCSTMQAKDEISNLSFSADGKKVLFDRCRGDGCQIQVYDLETGELAAYQSPAKERWTMARQSDDGKRIVFAVMPIVDGGLELADMQIAVMDVDGKNRRTITTGPGAKLYPTFSHSSGKVLYARAGFMRKQGHTPAAKYDAWEVDLANGVQTQLTFFQYFYMGSLAYFPGDERFIYYGEMPQAFPGLDLSKVNPGVALGMIREEQIKRNVGIGGMIVMKKGDALPRECYLFGPGFFPKSPLLSKDGSRLLVEKGDSGDFYQYSPDGNHRLVGGGGSVGSAAISPDGEFLGMIAVEAALKVLRVNDGSQLEKLYVSSILSNEHYRKLVPKIKLMPDLPTHVINTNKNSSR